MGPPLTAAGEPGGPVWAVVVAAGRGSRFGSAKQFAPLAGRSEADWSVDVAAACCDGVVLVVPAGSTPTERGRHPGAGAVVAGGETRSASVRAGLAAVPADAAIIAVHDAARPLSRPALWARVLDAVAAGADGAIPVVPVTDTVVRLDGSTGPGDPVSVAAPAATGPAGSPAAGSPAAGSQAAGSPAAGSQVAGSQVALSPAAGSGLGAGGSAFPGGQALDGRAGRLDGVAAETLDRNRLRAVQTPQAFRADVLRRAHLDAPDATDDATLVTALGGAVVFVEGDPENLKLTTPGDLLVAAALLERSSAP